MTYHILLSRTRRQHRLLRWLIRRHPLIARSAVGEQFLRRLSSAQRRLLLPAHIVQWPETTPPSVEQIAPLAVELPPDIPADQSSLPAVEAPEATPQELPARLQQPPATPVSARSAQERSEVEARIHTAATEWVRKLTRSARSESTAEAASTPLASGADDHPTVADEIDALPVAPIERMAQHDQPAPADLAAQLVEPATPEPATPPIGLPSANSAEPLPAEDAPASAGPRAAETPSEQPAPPNLQRRLRGQFTEISTPPATAAEPPSDQAPNEEIFASQGTDRSPQAWLARLTGAAQPGHTPPAPEAEAPPQPAAVQAPTPVAERRMPMGAPPPPPPEQLARPAQREYLSGLAAPGPPQHTPETGEIFGPRGTDRSPQAWLARLAGRPAATETPEPRPALPVRPVRAAQPQQRELPALLPETTRRFLRPAVGIDPDSVRVFRGPLSDQVASAARADAVTAGDDVLLAAGHTDDSPETLGLLAHELTHVALRRQPRFVPPLLHGTHSAADDEESLARAVEARAIRVARAMTPEAQPRHPGDVAGGAEVQPSPGAAPQQGPRLVERGGAEQPDQRAAWGNLPAPWEPLPDWLAPSAAHVPSAPAVAVVPPSVVRSGGPATGGDGMAAAPAIQLAERGRDLDVEVPAAAAASSGPPPGSGPESEPDLDELARQVYAVLKRRLAAERRRIGS